MKQAHHTQNGRLKRRLLLVAGTAVLVGLILAAGSEAIQHKQSRSDDSQSNSQNHHQNHQQSAGQQSQQPQQQQQASSANSNSVSSSQSVQSSIPQSSAGQQQQTASYSSSASSSISSSSQSAQPIQSISPNQQQQQQQQSVNSQVSAVPQSVSFSNYGPNSQKYYSDGMSAAASNPEQSYQAASQSVNMALASSGIGSYPTANQQQSNSSPLNHVHYLYYPGAKESSAGVQPKAASNANSQQIDMMNSASSSNNFQSLPYPSYADQLSSALSNMNSPMMPEAQASNQDPSYMAQPSQQQGNDMFGSASQQQSSQQQQQQQPNNQQQNSGQNSFNGDLNSFLNQQQSSQQQQQQQQQHNQPSSVSFNGPSSNGNNINGDYMNSHMGSTGHQQSASQPASSYQGASLYNQLGDLSTSNFGSNSGSLSSIASYVAPGQGQQSQVGAEQMYQGSNQQSPFNSAASQLSPSSVSPSNQQSIQQQSSLFGASSGSAQNGAANSIFSNPQYLSSFLNSQAAAQFGGGANFGQQDFSSPQMNLQQPSQQQQTAAASTTSSASVAPTSSKRFGISSLIMPMLALAGLSLLIPTVSSFGGPAAIGRRKRSVSEERGNASSRQQQISFEPVNGGSQIAKESSIIEYMDKIERYYSIYKNAVENDDCLNRLICEFGDAVKDVTGKSAVVTVIEKLVPAWMTGKVHLFKEAALENEKGKEKCKKYICQSSGKYH